MSAKCTTSTIHVYMYPHESDFRKPGASQPSVCAWFKQLVSLLVSVIKKAHTTNVLCMPKFLEKMFCYEGAEYLENLRSTIFHFQCQTLVCVSVCVYVDVFICLFVCVCEYVQFTSNENLLKLN